MLEGGEGEVMSHAITFDKEGGRSCRRSARISLVTGCTGVKYSEHTVEDLRDWKRPLPHTEWSGVAPPSLPLNGAAEWGPRTAETKYLYRWGEGRGWEPRLSFIIIL